MTANNQPKAWAPCTVCGDEGVVGRGRKLDACPICAARAEMEWRLAQEDAELLKRRRGSEAA